jgi:hypothetical protein
MDNATEEVAMNPTQHYPDSAHTPVPCRHTVPPAHHVRREVRRAHSARARAGVVGAAAIAVLLGSSLAASAAPVQALRAATGSPTDSKLEATFTTTAASVTPNLGTVELLLTGTGTVQGFGAATEVVGVIQDFTASPCGAGGASDTAQRRIVMTGGVLILHEAGMTCGTASGPQARATYWVDGRASTGIFAGARGTGDVTVNVTTHREILSGTLVLLP